MRSVVFSEAAAPTEAGSEADSDVDAPVPAPAAGVPPPSPASPPPRWVTAQLVPTATATTATAAATATPIRWLGRRGPGRQGAECPGQPRDRGAVLQAVADPVALRDLRVAHVGAHAPEVEREDRHPDVERPVRLLAARLGVDVGVGQHGQEP